MMMEVRKISGVQQSLFNLEHFEIQAVGDYYWEQAASELLPNLPIREQPKLVLLPNPEIREQIETGQTVLGYSIVTVKGTRYLLTHSKSTKYYPSDKGWFDLKIKQGKEYLYTRWRDGIKQKSRCLGRVVKLN
jgi:hypothetical protein